MGCGHRTRRRTQKTEIANMHSFSRNSHIQNLPAVNIFCAVCSSGSESAAAFCVPRNGGQIPQRRGRGADAGRRYAQAGVTARLLVRYARSGGSDCRKWRLGACACKAAVVARTDLPQVDRPAQRGWGRQRQELQWAASSRQVHGLTLALPPRERIAAHPGEFDERVD